MMKITKIRPLFWGIEMLPKVIVSKIKNVEDIQININRIFDSLNVEFLSSDFIAIKPNLCDFRTPEQGGTTDPRIIEAIIINIRNKSDCHIAIVESDHSLATADEEFERMGYKHLTEKYENVAIVNLSKDKKHQVKVDGYYFSELTVAETLLKTTKLINVAKLKTHTQTRITCVLKNQFGLISRRYKKRYHSSLNEVILDLIELFPPYLSIIDGIVAMEGAGPSDGTIRHTNVLICGDDPIVTDVVAAKAMGIKPLSVPVLRFAKKKKISNLKHERVKDLPNFKFKQVPWYSFAIRRFGLGYQKRAKRRYEKKQDRAGFLSDVAAGFIVLSQGKYPTLQSGLIDRKIFWRVVTSIIRRPFVLIKLKLKGI